MDDGAVRIRTVALEEALSSTDTDNGGKIYKHIRLAFDTLDQTINIFNETFGTPVDGALIVKNTKQRQLVNYYNGFMPTGKGSSSVAYWAGLRVDMQHGTRFETENENDGFLYFGNANNGGLGANAARWRHTRPSTTITRLIPRRISTTISRSMSATSM